VQLSCAFDTESIALSAAAASAAAASAAATSAVWLLPCRLLRIEILLTVATFALAIYNLVAGGLLLCWLCQLQFCIFLTPFAGHGHI
jgi:hypothetical protein